MVGVRRVVVAQVAAVLAGGRAPVRQREEGLESLRKRTSVLIGAASLAAFALLSAPGGAAADEGRGSDVTAHLVTSFDGINHFIDRPLAGASIEPPEQGLCAGHGYVVESVASAIAIYDTHGNLVRPATSLNSFYGYPEVAQLGPRLNDPSCYFDAATQRWFHAVLAIDFTLMGTHVVPTGGNHVDVAVSKTADPTGAWTFLKVPAQDDCAAESTPPWIDPHMCLGDFPRIGADAHGLYVTTNDYSYLSHAFRSASVYAVSKQALETDAASAAVTHIDTAAMVRGEQAGFTLQPAQASSPGDPSGTHGGTEYFLSSNAADEVNATHSRASTDLVVWALSNTRSLESGQPALQLTNTVMTVDGYAFPPTARQKAGPTPLADCLNDTHIQVAPATFGCWNILGLPAEPSHTWTEGQSIDTGDTRMQQVVVAQGVVYGALGTAVGVGGARQAGLEWFAVRPRVEGHGDVDAQLVGDGYVARADTALIAPAIAVDGQGWGAIAFSLMGPNDYPSAAYVAFDAHAGTGDIRLAATGAGPDDGYTNYAVAFGAPPRTRWGDYGAAIAEGSRIWMASEYIGQACTLMQWLTTGLTCNNTRRGAANWDTRITAVTVDR